MKTVACTLILVLLCSTSASGAVPGQQLSTYDDIESHLLSGFKVRFWINYFVCSFDGDPPPGVNAWGGGEVDTFTIDSGRHIQSNQGKLIFNYQSEKGGYVYDLVSLNLYNNASVVLSNTT